MEVRDFLLRWHLATWTQSPAIAAAGVAELLTLRPDSALPETLTPAQQAVRDDFNLTRDVARIQGKYGVKTRLDADYPPRLTELANPPLVLFYAGNWAILNQLTLAVVGARQAGRYTHQALYRLTPRNASLTVVSGLANGADTFAHHWALGNGWPTVAVVANGLDLVYPATNRDLQARIATEGLVVSEYPPGTPPRPYRFVARNRIIAGLAHGVLVTEAAAKSGSLITANLALEANREVLAVPNRLDEPLGVGTNALIAAGATPVTTPEALLAPLRYYP